MRCVGGRGQSQQLPLPVSSSGGETTNILLRGEERGGGS